MLIVNMDLMALQVLVNVMPITLEILTLVASPHKTWNPVAQLWNVDQMLSVQWFLELPNVFAPKAILETHLVLVWILMNAQRLIVVKMLSVSIFLEVMIVAVKKITLEIHIKFAQKKMMKKGMICAKPNSVVQMQCAI